MSVSIHVGLPVFAAWEGPWHPGKFGWMDVVIFIFGLYIVQRVFSPPHQLECQLLQRFLWEERIQIIHVHSVAKTFTGIGLKALQH